MTTSKSPLSSLKIATLGFGITDRLPHVLMFSTDHTNHVDVRLENFDFNIEQKWQ